MKVMNLFPPRLSRYLALLGMTSSALAQSVLTIPGTDSDFWTGINFADDKPLWMMVCTTDTRQISFGVTDPAQALALHLSKIKLRYNSRHSAIQTARFNISLDASANDSDGDPIEISGDSTSGNILDDSAPSELDDLLPIAGAAEPDKGFSQITAQLRSFSAGAGR